MKFKDLFGLKKAPIKNIEISESFKVDEVSENIIAYEELKNKILDREYYFGKYKIILKDFHVLDVFQKKYPLYDQFLPSFCKDFKGLIIDVGANIGDTTIAIFSKNVKSFIVSVEPDIDFYNDCLFNISNNGLDERSMVINKFVSTKIGSFVVKKNESLSTGSIEELKQETNQSNNTISFSELMDLVPETKKETFDILKIDTDGFDWDVIQSFVEYIKNDVIKPRFAFFEMQTFINDNENSNEGSDEFIDNYKKALLELKIMGYTKFCLFDNFGTYFKTTESIDEIIELAYYIRRSQLLNSYSTIYYFDILAYPENENIIVNDAINKIYSYENFS